MSQATVRDSSFFGHPRGLAVLFFTEMWERFGFYGMRALLILYLTASVADGGLEFDAARAGALYALYTSLVYLIGLPGGWFADHVVGQRRAVLYGGILMAIGYCSLAIDQTWAFYGGLGLVICGTGLLKPNISAIVGQLYDRDDERRDSGFSLFYMGINIGAFAGPFVCGYLGEKVDWQLGFGAAGIGMILGVLIYVTWGRTLGDAGLHPSLPDDPDERARHIRRNRLLLSVGAIGVAGTVAAIAGGFWQPDIVAVSDSFGVVLVVITLAFFGWLFVFNQWTAVERGRLAAIFLLFLAASVFWGAYEQAGSSLNLFARDDTNRMLGSYEFPASWFQQAPALFVIILAPVFAFLWLRMGSRQPSSPMKFVLGLVFVGLGFAFLAFGSTFAAGGTKVSPMWLVGTYLLHVIGEMCLSPVGLSTVTKLAPERVTGLMLGVWFLASAVGNYAGGRAAGLYETLPLWQLFGIIAGTTVGAGLILLVLVRPIRRLMGGVH